MKNVYQITWAVGFVCSLALITVISLTGGSPFVESLWVYAIDVAAFIIIALFYYLFKDRGAKKFERVLAKENFTADKTYEWEGRKVMFDFSARKFATDYFVVKQVFFFDEIVGSMIEISKQTEDRVLPPDKIRVSLLISVKMRDNGDKLFFLPMYCVVIDEADVEKIGYDMPEDIIAKYEDLSRIRELRDVIRGVLERNHADGFVSAAPVYEDLQDFTESVADTAFRRDNRL